MDFQGYQSRKEGQEDQGTHVYWDDAKLYYCRRSSEHCSHSVLLMSISINLKRAGFLLIFKSRTPRKTPIDNVNTKSLQIVFACTVLVKTQLMNWKKNRLCGSVVYRLHMNKHIEQWRHNTPQTRHTMQIIHQNAIRFPKGLPLNIQPLGRKGNLMVRPYRQNQPANKRWPTWPTEKKPNRQRRHEIIANRFCLHIASKHQTKEPNRHYIMQRQIEQWTPHKQHIPCKGYMRMQLDSLRGYH